MKTVMLQSFRTHDVPRWLRRCLRSVRTHAELNRWAYECLDDRFFDFAPDWARRRCGRNIYALTDVCRLLWIRDKLNAGFDRVIWADADILIFNSARIDVTTPNGHAFAHELFLQQKPDGGFMPNEGVNNAFMVFERNQDVLEQYIEACYSRLQSYDGDDVPRTALGPRLTDELASRQPLHRLHGVGLFTLAIMKEIAGHGGPLTRYLARHTPSPLGAANLCHFLRNATPALKRPGFDHLYNKAVSRLMASRGELTVSCG